MDCGTCKWNYENRRKSGELLLHEMYVKYRGNDPCGFCVHTAEDNFEPVEEATKK